MTAKVDQDQGISEDDKLKLAEKRAAMLRLVVEIKKLQLMTAEAEDAVRHLEETATVVDTSGNRVRSALQSHAVSKVNFNWHVTNYTM